MKCPNCREGYPRGARSCPNCGYDPLKNRTTMSKVFDALVIISGLVFGVFGLESQEWIAVVLGAVMAISGIGLWITLDKESRKRNLIDSIAVHSGKRP